jgi:2-keto-4-pentenoate hydratase
MDARTVDTLAERLVTAERTRTPIELPSLLCPGMTDEDGYRIQRAVVAKKVAAGARVVGRKLAFTSQGNQRLFGVHEPAYGHLLDDGVHAEGVPVEASAFIQPIVECEITFLMRRRLAGPGVTVPDVVDATETIVPSLEIADSRLANWIGRARAADIVADSCGHAGIIMGGRRHSPARFDLQHTGVVAEKNGQIIATAATGAVMGNPARAVAWLVNKLAEDELALEAGELVLAGAIIGAVPMAAGDRLRASFGSGLGRSASCSSSRALARPAPTGEPVWR